MNKVKTLKPPFEGHDSKSTVRWNEMELMVDGIQFLFTKEMIDEHLSEGFGEDETVICTVDNTSIELNNGHYRWMKLQIERW